MVNATFVFPQKEIKSNQTKPACELIFLKPKQNKKCIKVQADYRQKTKELRALDQEKQHFQTLIDN